MRFREYVAEAKKSIQHLEFLLDNLGEVVTLDCSIESLEKVETAFWFFVRKGIPDEMSDLNQFANLIGQYLGECIIHHTGAKWVQCTDENARFGQPCIDGFGGRSWDRVFPAEFALHIRDLPNKKPNFPGVRDKRVFASALERGIAVHKKTTGAARHDN